MAGASAGRDRATIDRVHSDCLGSWGARSQRTGRGHVRRRDFAAAVSTASVTGGGPLPRRIACTPASVRPSTGSARGRRQGAHAICHAGRHRTSEGRRSWIRIAPRPSPHSESTLVIPPKPLVVCQSDSYHQPRRCGIGQLEGFPCRRLSIVSNRELTKRHRLTLCSRRLSLGGDRSDPKRKPPRIEVPRSNGSPPRLICTGTDTPVRASHHIWRQFMYRYGSRPVSERGRHEQGRWMNERMCRSRRFSTALTST